MWATRWLMATVVAAGIGAAGCAGGMTQQSPEDALAQAADPDAVTVHVDNHNWQDVDVYALHDGMRYRLGMVTSMSGQNFRVPLGVLTQTGDFRLLVDPIGSNQSYVTDPLLVSPGQQIKWSVENHLSLSSYRIY